MSDISEEFQADRTRTSSDDAALWRRFRGAAGEDAKVSALQKLKLTGSAPTAYSLHLENLLPPDDRRGEALLRDVWRIGQQRIVLQPGQSPWSVEMPSRHFADRVHRFGWAADLLAQGETGRARLIALTDDWTLKFGKFHGFAWRLEPTTSRCWNWLRCGPDLLEAGDDAARTARLESLSRQLRYVQETLGAANDPKSRWLGAVVLVAGSLCLRAGSGLGDALDRLEAECTAQILPDGGHVTRSPAHVLSALIHLQTLSGALQRAGRPVPDWMDKWIPRIGAMLAFFQAGDGALNTFHDGDESRPEVVNAALARLPAPPRKFMFAPKSGFQKVEKGPLRLVLDCGEAPPRPFGDQARAGALGFELSDGAARIVTSCGYSAEVNVDWQAAVRRTSAHSTLVLGGRDSGVFIVNDETRLRALIGPEGIAAKRLEEAAEIWLDAQHAGYKAAYGLLHRRRIFISGEGDRLTGEDSLVRPVAQTPSDDKKHLPFEIRFHLHPTVTAMMSKDAIRLMCDNGRVWRFRTSHEGARLEKTVYLARGIVEQPEQIVLAGFADPNGDGSQPPNCIRWAFVRES
ncbi:MAG: heparinase [Hyphomonas sp.]|uniref:heparinase II/III family protein n=1 Tax=Hyphomonas sp. TaxID=87 RepID=UPI001858BDED|nr:heparinase II/III family protein [Hyphomonas sp.]MBA3069051.1 heparinase [Hyphomonas sp.]MBU4061685.1 heparinase II/III family protein [Alphaproteobacteria bacterium]MBU4163530.1 heparinase II/III family protein [Alphaproteobacteria bacterium]